MTLNDALNKTSMAARPHWKNKAVVIIGGMMLLMSFEKGQLAEWADGKYGQAITDEINAGDYEPVEYSLDQYISYRIVGQVFNER